MIHCRAWIEDGTDPLQVTVFGGGWIATPAPSGTYLDVGDVVLPGGSLWGIAYADWLLELGKNPKGSEAFVLDGAGSIAKDKHSP